MTQKKNRFLTFCFSLIPGAGEMYMGFMKMGISLMGLFMAILTIAYALDFGELSFISFIVWFYSFFHVNNLASLPDDEFYAVEDDYMFHLSEPPHTRVDFLKTYRKPLSAAFIIFGIVLVWQGFDHLIYRLIENINYNYIGIYQSFTYSLPKLIAGAAIIVLGYLMIRGKKKEIDAKMNISMETEVKTDDGNEHTKEHE